MPKQLHSSHRASVAMVKQLSPFPLNFSMKMTSRGKKRCWFMAGTTASASIPHLNETALHGLHCKLTPCSQCQCDNSILPSSVFAIYNVMVSCLLHTEMIWQIENTASIIFAKLYHQNKIYSLQQPLS